MKGDSSAADFSTKKLEESWPAASWAVKYPLFRALIEYRKILDTASGRLARFGGRRIFLSYVLFKNSRSVSGSKHMRTFRVPHRGSLTLNGKLHAKSRWSGLHYRRSPRALHRSQEIEIECLALFMLCVCGSISPVIGIDTYALWVVYCGVCNIPHVSRSSNLAAFCWLTRQRSLLPLHTRNQTSISERESRSSRK